MKTIQVKGSSEIPKNFTGIAEFPSGTKIWYKEGKLHREGGPAVEWADGRKEWYKEGAFHREDGPAVEWADGTKSWYLNGLRYPEEEWKLEVQKLKESKIKAIQVNSSVEIPENFTGIAVWNNRTKAWYKEGEWHREGEPAIEYSDGSKAWYKEGKLHREDGPACEYSDGAKYWFKEGNRHREDGPAVELSFGAKFWYLNGLKYPEEEWKLEVQKLKESKMETIKVNSSAEIPENFTGIAEYSDGLKKWYKEGQLHREDGPAIELSDGTKYWYKEGKLHRENGPAVEYSNGTKKWYKDGRFHREDGPAVEWVDGSKYWYKEGELHREDGPAKIYTNGDKEWCKEGKYHREDGPAIERANGNKFWYLNDISYPKEEWKLKVQKLKESKMETIQVNSSAAIPKNFTGIAVYRNGTKSWYKEGILHREDGPALEYADGSKYWYKEGEYHRLDGPACEWKNGDKAWYKEGKCHRENGPAVEYSDGTKKWLKEGKKHRTDGPAVEYSDGIKFWYLDGFEYSEKEWKHKVQEMRAPKMETIKVKTLSEVPKNFTGVAEFSNGDKSWFKEGKIHREDGPAIELANGIKEWFINNQRHRLDGPALEYSDKLGFWYKNDLLHREDGPAIERKDGMKEWFKEGKKHREDGPAVEYSSGHKEWWFEGNLHRTDGPVVEFPEGVSRWALNGKILSEKEWKIQVGDITSNIAVPNSKLVETIKSDAAIAATRIASQRIISTAKTLITKLLKQKGNTESTITKFLNSNYGNVITGAVASVLLKSLASRFEGKYSRVINEISDELRISSEVLIIDELSTHILNASEVMFNELTTKNLVRVAVEEIKESSDDNETDAVNATETTQKAILSAI